MSQKLHKIDRPFIQKYTKKELEKFMIFCILDTAVSYEKVCEAYDALDKRGMTTRSGLKGLTVKEIARILKNVGYRWANQKARYIHDFAYSGIDLRKASRKEIVEQIDGIGMKLASMFLRNTRGEKYAVLDVHTLRWIEREMKAYDQWEKGLKYEQLEQAFINFAEILGKSPTELDMEIWERERIGNKRYGNT